MNIVTAIHCRCLLVVVLLVVASAPGCRITVAAPAGASPARAPFPGGVPRDVVPLNEGSLFLDMAL